MEELINKWKKLLELRLTKTGEIKYDNCIVATEDLQTAINLIKKQQEQLQEKDKIIDVMGEEYSLEANTDVFDICACCNHNNEDCHGDYCKEALIEYFTKKAREV